MAESVSHTSQGSPSYTHHLVWLDKNLKDAENEDKFNRLQELDERMRTFTSKTKCLAYLDTLNERNVISYVIFIISAGFSEEFIAQLEEYQCILAIFISCNESERNNQLESDMVTICTNTNLLIHRILGCIGRDNLSMDFKLMSMPNETDGATAGEQRRIGNFKEDHAYFLWFYKCHSFMLNLNDDDEQAKEDMLNICRPKCNDSRQELKLIKKFEKEPIDENAENALWWYTQNSVVIGSMNNVLASGDIESIYDYRYLIKLICQQLKNLHRERIKSNTEEILQLFRGQVLKLSEILDIKNHANDLISFNSFLSTSSEEDVAKTFCNARKKPDHESVIFIINIDLTSKQNIAFADIRKFSRYEYEEEILFSIGSVFRIDSVGFDEEKGYYRIHLSLNSHDQLAVNNYIEQTYPNEASIEDLPVLFGKLLFDMGKYHFAIKYYQDRIENLSSKDNHHRPTYLNNLGACYNAIGNKDDALKYYTIAQQIYEQTKNNQGLGACYHNMASYYYDQQDYNTASKYALQALEKQNQYSLEKAVTLDLLGTIRLAKGDISAARDNYQAALHVRLKILERTNPNHPDIGLSYQNLGKLDTRSSLYVDAQENYQRADQIFRTNYHPTHSLVVDITKRLQDIGRRLGN